MLQLRTSRVPANHEEVFAAHYDVLMKQALYWTNRDKSQAEDLVHDVFVQYVELKAQVHDPKKTLGYLCRMLRNLYISRMRRATKLPMAELSLVDYDTAEWSLKQADRRALLLARFVLQQICAYACQRKSQSLSSGVLILRFFHGYYPSEIVAICKSTRTSVDNFLRIARREAKAMIEQPDKLASMDKKPVQQKSADYILSEDMLADLRQFIFAHLEGPCFTPEEINRRYSPEDGDPLSAPELAHLVSCKPCLDRVNTKLGLPKLADRYPADTIGRDSGPGKGAGAGGSNAAAQFIVKAKRRAQGVKEHRPNCLQIAVNGRIKASQTVTSAVSKLDLRVDFVRTGTFLEILSEQNICLLHLPIESRSGFPQQDQSVLIPLSDKRLLEVDVVFELEGMRVSVVYRDPLLHEESDSAIASSEAVPKLTGIVTSERFIRPELGKILHLAFNVAARRLSRLRKAISSTAIPDMNPTFATALVLGVCSIALFFHWWRQAPNMTPAALLVRAEAWDDSAQKDVTPGVVFQKVRIKTPVRTSERTLYRDIQHRRQVRERNLDAEDTKLRARLSGAGVDWNNPLSPGDFRDWRNREGAQTNLVKRTGPDRLTLTTSVSRGDVLSESLTVRASDFHTVGKTIELRDYGTVEIAELNYDVVPWGAVNQDWFEPLVGNVVSDAPIHGALHLPHALSSLELDEAELAARITLNQLHADTGEPIQLTRTNTGIDIKGVVDTNIRKEELVSRLAALAHVRTSILSAEEVGTHSPVRSTVDGEPAIQVHSVEAQPSPLEQYLREKRLPMDQLATISHELLAARLTISQAQIHFSEVQLRFKEANQLPDDLQAQLVTLSHTYLGAIEAGLDANQRTLLSLGFNSSTQPGTIPAFSSAEDNIDAQIRLYRQLCLELITNGTGESRPAAVIAEELINTSEQIRLHLATMSATAPKDSN